MIELLSCSVMMMIFSLCCSCILLIVLRRSKRQRSNRTNRSIVKPNVKTGTCIEATGRAPGPIFGYEYSRRKKLGNDWVCDKGWSDTGCGSKHGPRVGKLECRKQADVKPGRWESPWYGNAKDENNKRRYRVAKCPDKQNITGIVLHGGEDDNAQTNAINAFCSREDFGDVSSAFKGTYSLGLTQGCGKTGFTHAGEMFKMIGAVLGDFFSFDLKFTGAFGQGAKKGQEYTKYVDNTVNPGAGNKSWTPYMALSPTGFVGWEVIPGGKDAGCPKSGLCGLKMYTAEGASTGWAGGEGSRLKKDHKDKRQIGRCPAGKIVKEIRTDCGDRVDGIQFICDVP